MIKFIRAAALLTAFFALAATLFSACGDSKNSEPNGATLTVSTNNLLLSNDTGAEASFTITTDAAWTAQSTGLGFNLSQNAGTGSATILVRASAATAAAPEQELGTITVRATGVEGEQLIRVRWSPAAPQPPTPGDVTITLDFAQGPAIATPALPLNSETVIVNGRGEYVMQGYTFAIYADPAENGKYLWTDNSQYPGNIPEPNKGLYFSKLGAYIEFPAIAGKALSTVVYTFNNGGGGDVTLEIMDTDDNMAPNMATLSDDGTYQTFEMIEPEVNTAYRLEVTNKKNAQVAKLVLTYVGSAE